MALTRDSFGIGETASVERQEPERGARRADFPTGTFVRTRSSLVDAGVTDSEATRPMDVGYVREDWEPDEFVPVRWSQAGCGCSTAKENPADLVKITEAEYNLFVAGYSTGYNTGFDNAS